MTAHEHKQPISRRDEHSLARERKTTGAETGGAWCLQELSVPAGFEGAPMHTHAQTIEAYYVLGGTLAFTVDERTFTMPKGAYILIHPGTAHTFWNPTTQPARCLLIASPADEDAWLAPQPAQATTA